MPFDDSSWSTRMRVALSCFGYIGWSSTKLLDTPMRRLAILLTIVLFALPLRAQPDPQNPEGDNLATPPTWVVRTDRPMPDVKIGSVQDSVDIWFVNMTPGWHITTGPAAIFYHPYSIADGWYRVETTIHLFDPGERREAYGLFFAGQHLDTDSITYDYFLLRNSGEFLIKRRVGAETAVINDWTPHDAIVTYGPDSEGSIENKIAVVNGPNDVLFWINNQLVARLPHGEVNTQGTYGLRINHALNVHVSNLIAMPM